MYICTINFPFKILCAWLALARPGRGGPVGSLVVVPQAAAEVRVAGPGAPHRRRTVPDRGDHRLGRAGQGPASAGGENFGRRPGAEIYPSQPGAAATAWGALRFPDRGSNRILTGKDGIK